MTRKVNLSPDWLIALAQQVELAGFDDFGIVRAADVPDRRALLQTFIDKGRHGSMGWMADNQQRRGHPHGLWPETGSVIMLAMNYGPAQNPLDAPSPAESGVISVYAKGKDYHSIIIKRLKQVASWLHRQLQAEVKVFVDTAPVMEKPLAMQAGLGWQGKHTNLVSRRFGSWLFLGAIYTTALLPKSEAEADHCGACSRCLDSCPTDAFAAPYQLDARRCISYLTIEHRGHIDKELRRGMGNRVFGCDDCLAVCPWNKFAAQAREQRFHARTQCDNPPLAALLQLDKDGFQQRFQGTPVKRTGRNGLVRNALIAAGNGADRSLVPLIKPLLQDEAAIVRAMAVWALMQLIAKVEFLALKAAHAPEEPDAYVLNEWGGKADE